MSLRFYKTPGAERPWRPPVMDEDCRRYRRRTRRSNKWIPPRLAFEEIIRNNTASVSFKQTSVLEFTAPH